MARKHAIIGMSAPVTIAAADGAQADGPKTFTSKFYTGGPLNIAGWDLPVVVDLAGLKPANVLVANLDHDKTKRVGNFEVANDGKELTAIGKATAATAARDEVVNSAQAGYQWQASLEVSPIKVETLAKGKTATVNGQQISGPAYITREGTLKGFGFVSHGADDNTTATIAAAAASKKGNEMDPKLKEWIEAMGFDVDKLDADQLAGLTANYNGQQAKPKKVIASDNPFETRKVEAKRKQDIRDIADSTIDRRNSNEEEIDAIEKMYDHAIKAGMSVQEFRLELMEATAPQAQQIRAPRDKSSQVNNRILEAAICQAGRIENLDKHFDDQTLQLAHDRFKSGGIGLKQLLLVCAEANGYRGSYSTDVNVDVQRAAFGMSGPRQIKAEGWSTIDIGTILSNTANKFIREGWDAVDMTPMRLASVRNVRNFQQITTVSLTGALDFEKLGAAGEIKHGTLGEVVYNNKADTYAKMLAITRQDIINDDLGALTAVPRKLGRGAGLKLNDLFWTAFLYGETSGFFSATHTTVGNTGNSNLNSGAADMTVAGLAATEAMFLNQVGPDGKPLGVMPAIVLVPTALKAAAMTLMTSERLITGATSVTQGDANIWRGRFRVESSPYMSNSAYTGYDAAKWYMLADPAELPTIEIVALNGRVEPVVETADADFNVLGIQMRGYSDVGVALQEFRACVKADGGAS